MCWSTIFEKRASFCQNIVEMGQNVKLKIMKGFCCSIFPSVAETGIILNLITELASGQYTVLLRVSDNQGLEQDSTVQATVCDCSGEGVSCQGRIAGGPDLSVILGILGGILLLLSKSGI